MRKKALFPIFFVYFLDNFSFAVVFPLFSTLILTTQFQFLPFYETLSQRTFMLGLLNASFPLALLIGAPIMGNLSDHYGRKKTFFITILGTIFGNIFTATSLLMQNYVLLLLSRFFCGFFSGNLSLCLAAISDLSPNDKTRSKNFGTLTAVSGLSWVIAMLAGGYLSFQTINPDFSPPLPFWIVAAIGICNLLILVAYFPETHKVKERLNLRLSPIFHQIIQAFRTHHLRPLFIVQCLFMFGWLMIFQWFSGYSVAHFGLTRNITGISLSLIGVFWIFGATGLNRHLIKYIALKNIPRFGLIILTILFAASSFVPEYTILVGLDCLIALIVSFTAANLFNLISLTARESIQGKVLGLSQSVVTLAQFAAPVFGSMVPIQNIPLLYRISALAALIALAIFHAEKLKPSIN